MKDMTAFWVFYRLLLELVTLVAEVAEGIVLLKCFGSLSKTLACDWV